MEATFFQRHPVLKDTLNVSIFILCVIIGTLFINSFIFRSFSVVGPSMEPTLHTNDRLIINRLNITWSHLLGKSWVPERGQVIVFKNPHYDNGLGDEYIVKRVIAFGGERVVLKNGDFTVYNDENPKGFDPDESHEYVPPVAASGAVDKLVPKNELFVVGDHREGSFSNDSRSGLGTIPLHDVVGPVVFRIFPFTKIGGL